MRTDRSRATSIRPLQALLRATLVSIAGVVMTLASLGAVLVPAPAGAAAPPAQGWTTQQAPLPSDAGTAGALPDVYTASSTCPTLGGCVTVGWYSDTAAHPWGLIETQSGTTWTDTQAPQPSNAGSGANQALWLGSQSCGIINLNPCHAVSFPTATLCFR